MFDDPAYRELLIALARQVLAQAPVAAMPLDGFDPADLEGSLDRMAEFNRGSAKTHSGIYRDLAILHRPTEVAAILGPLSGPLIRRVAELIAAIERGEPSCTRANLDLLAAYERLDRLGRPLNAVAAVLRRPGPRGGADGPLAGQPVAVKDIVGRGGRADRLRQPGQRPGAGRGRRQLVDAGCGPQAPRCSPPRSAWSTRPASRTRTSATPATPAIRPGPRAGRRAARPPWSRPASATWPSAPIPAGRSGSRPPTAAIVGLKPSYGLVPLDGVFPLSPSCDHAGTLTATVAGAAACCPSSPALPAEPPAGEPASGALHRGRAGRATRRPVGDARGAGAVTAALDALAAAGWELREVSAPWLDELPGWEESLAVIVAREAYQVHTGRDTSRYAGGHQGAAGLRARRSPSDAVRRGAGRAGELTAAVDASLAGVDVLAGPTVGYRAPRSRTRRSGPARTTARAGSPGRTT